MKLILSLLLFPIAVLLTSCSKSTASMTDDGEDAGSSTESGAQFKEGHGLSLTPLMAKAIGLQTAEVQEETIAPVFTTALQTMERGTEASGWITEAQAARIQPGMEVELDLAGGKTKGSVLRLEKSPYVTLGDFEIKVQAREIIDAGTALTATFRFSAGDAVPTIPKNALLTTAEGTFVYAKNDAFYVRTQVKTGARSNDQIEITDGLYAGDEIVTSAVMSLWLAELQVLRGGKSCTCGH
ncbi:hypothetical protein [Prosthecobacter sp.]|uniref:hypothetical protein n=1 Tax=Prosthecobacter sp. TaxID=1965333 RepID=UPI0037835939